MTYQGNTMFEKMIIPKHYQTVLNYMFWISLQRKNISSIPIYLNTEYGKMIAKHRHYSIPWFGTGVKYYVTRNIVNRADSSFTIPTRSNYNRTGVLGTKKALQSIAKQSRDRLYKSNQTKEHHEITFIIGK